MLAHTARVTMTSLTANTMVDLNGKMRTWKRVTTSKMRFLNAREAEKDAATTM